MSLSNGKELEVHSKMSEGEIEDKAEDLEECDLSKKIFQLMYNFSHALKMVIVKDFHEDLVDDEVFRHCLKSASSFDIKKEKDGFSEAVLYYSTVTKGDGAYLDLKTNIENEKTKIFHPLFQRNKVNKYWEGLREISKLAKAPKSSSLGERQHLQKMILLENVPESVAEEELIEKYPEAHNVIAYPHVKGVKGVRLLEFLEEAAALKFIREHKSETLGGSSIKISNFLKSSSDYEKKKKDEPYLTCTFTDDERMEKCDSLLEIQQELGDVLDSTNIYGDDKLAEYVTLLQKFDELNEEVKGDTDFRLLKEQDLPEADEVKKALQYTIYAESDDWIFSDRTKKAAESYDIPFDRSKRNELSRRRRKRKNDSKLASEDSKKFKKSNSKSRSRSRERRPTRFDNNRGDNKSHTTKVKPAKSIQSASKGSTSNGELCYKCGEKGHMQRECRKGLKCFKCDGSGHTSRDCTSYLPNGKGSAKDQICYNCRGEGHFARNCPSGWGGKEKPDRDRRPGPPPGGRRGGDGGPGGGRGDMWMGSSEMDHMGGGGGGMMPGPDMNMGGGNVMDMQQAQNVASMLLGQGGMSGQQDVSRLLQTLSQAVSGRMDKPIDMENNGPVGRRY